MLLIQNIEKLENQKVNQDWVVFSVYKKASAYVIILRTDEFPYRRVIELSRIGELQSNGNYEYFFFNEQGKKTHTSLTIEQIKDIDNVVRALNWFTT